MKVLVCGGRDFNDKRALFNALDGLRIRGEISQIITGGARGADELAEEWSRSRQVRRTVYPAKWNLLGKRAGLARNLEMLDKEGPDLVVAFPGGRGTAHMISISKERGFEVMIAL